MSMSYAQHMPAAYGQPQPSYGQPQPTYGQPQASPQPSYRGPAPTTYGTPPYTAAPAASPYPPPPRMMSQPAAVAQPSFQPQASQYTRGQPAEIHRTDGSWGSCTVTEVGPDGTVDVSLDVGGVRRLHHSAVAQRLRPRNTGMQAQTYAAPQAQTYAAPPAPTHVAPQTYAAPPPTYAAPQAQTYAAPPPEYAHAVQQYAHPVQQASMVHNPHASMIQTVSPIHPQVGLPSAVSMIAYPQPQQEQGTMVGAQSVLGAQSVGPGTEFQGPARATSASKSEKKEKKEKKAKKEKSKKKKEKSKGCCA